jgi:S1-C subfamily serine protease
MSYYVKHLLAFAISFFVTLAFLVTFVHAEERPADFDQKVAQIFDPSVKIRNLTEKGSCSATFFESTPDYARLSTARHCAKGMKDKFSISYHGEDFAAKVFKRAPDSDAMILEIDRPKDRELPTFSTAKFATAEDLQKLFYGQKIYNSSHPLGTSDTYSEGFLGLSEQPPSNPKEAGKLKYLFLKTNINIAPGSSGSCLFTKNDVGDFICIGTATAILMPFFYLGYFTPINYTTDLLADGS